MQHTHVIHAGFSLDQVVNFIARKYIANDSKAQENNGKTWEGNPMVKANMLVHGKGNMCIKCESCKHEKKGKEMLDARM